MKYSDMEHQRAMGGAAMVAGGVVQIFVTWRSESPPAWAGVGLMLILIGAIALYFVDPWDDL